jgi:hypothetical protein
MQALITSPAAAATPMMLKALFICWLVYPTGPEGSRQPHGREKREPSRIRPSSIAMDIENGFHY